MAQLSLDFDNYTYPVEVVIYHEKGKPRTPEDERKLWASWCAQNRAALEEMENFALDLYYHNKPVAAQYVIEHQRYEGACPIEGIEWYDQHGGVHRFKISNTHAALLARHLLRKFPFLAESITTNPSEIAGD